MALVNWNPVAAVNFSESNALRLAAQQQLAGGIKGIGDTAVAFNDATGKANTDILLNSLVGQRTPEAAMAAIEAAKAQAGGMYNNYDQAAFRSAAEALPKSAADAQELDFQTADKPYLQAAALAYSRGDREAVGNFAKEVKSNAGRAELSKLIGDSHTMGVQDAGVLNAEGKLAEEIRNNKAKEKIDWFEARKNPKGSGGDNVFGRQVLTAQQSLQALNDRYAKEDLTATTGTVADREALQATINGKDGAALDSWGNGTPKNMHKVLMETSPAYAGAGAKKQNSVLRSLIQENTTQTGGGWWDSKVNRDLTDEQITTRGSVILGEVTAETDTLRKQEVTSEQTRSLAKLRGELTLKGDPAANASDEVLYEVLYPGWNEQQRQASAGTPPPKPSENTTEAERILRDKAVSKQKGEARKKTQQGNTVPTVTDNTSAADKLLNVGKSFKADINSIPSVIKTGFNAVVPVKYQKPPEDPEAVKAYASIEAKLKAAETRRYTDALFAEIKADEAAKVKLKSQLSKSVVPSTQTASTPKAKSVSVTLPPVVKPVETNQAGIEQALPTDIIREAPAAATVLKSSVKQAKTGSAPIATTTKTGTWETMFKQVANKANEVISGKGWSNDPKNQDQYENGLVVDGETTQPSAKHEINIMGMWDKDNNVKSQFLGNYDTFKGYAVRVKVKGGEEYVIPITYDEIAAHTGANTEDIHSAGTMDIRNNAVVQRRVYRTALDKLTTQLSNSKGK